MHCDCAQVGVQPKDSLTGRRASTTNMGVPATWDSWKTRPRFLLRTP